MSWLQDLLALQVIAACYDNPIPGYGTNTVGNLRLWEAKPVTEFDLEEFNEGHYTEVQSGLSLNNNVAGLIISMPLHAAPLLLLLCVATAS